MAWPTPQDYNEAVQNPDYTFSDPELQGGACEVTALGLPKPITGNFASVYRLRCSGRDWAVRCFWRELTDMQQRYRAISSHLAAVGLPYTVGFEYQPQGIRVRGNWYPILKMEWVEGELLNDYLIAHLQDSAGLQALMDRWSRMVSDLERSGCAHGDLQHGNVMVVNGELKLVDYDGMFVPSLAGLGSHELGQQHYQHPLRSAADFGPQLDRFSTWVIYLSIQAVRVDPSIWAATGAGDERLLLQKKDFENPGSSTSLALLTNHTDPGLQSLAQQFRATLDQSLPSVPSLASALRPASERNETDDLPAARLSLRLHLLWRSCAPSVEGGMASSSGAQSGSHPEWVVEYLPARPEETVVDSVDHVNTARIASLAALPLAGIGVVGLMTIGAPAVLATVLLVLLWGVACVVTCVVTYRRVPAVRTLLPLVRREAQALQGIAEAERSAHRIAAKKEAAGERNARDRKEAEARMDDLQRAERARLDGLLEELSGTLATIDLRIRDVDQRETEETERLLKELQNRYIADALRRATLRSASIPGVGRSAKMRLWTLGVWAAADVSSDRIRSMQHLKHDHLMEVVSWRVETETGARRTMPGHLPRELKQALHQRYSRERIELVADRSEAQASTEQAMREVQESFGRRRARVEEQLSELLEDRSELCTQLDTQLSLANTRRRELRDALRTVREEMNQCESVSFRRFAQSVSIPWTRGDYR